MRRCRSTRSSGRVKRGTGELEGVNYEPITYEGYAPSGVALYIEALTDNRNRTGSDIRSLLSKNGGSLAEPGAVAWQFERKGVVLVPGTVDEDELMLTAIDAGADDVAADGELWRVTCEPTDFNSLRAAIDDAGIAYESADLTFVATSTVELTDAAALGSVLKLIEVLDDHDDVQDVHANWDASDELVERIG